MVDLSPPWIRADLAGITSGSSVETFQRLKCLLEGFAEEALLHSVPPYDLILAFQDMVNSIEQERLCGQPIETFMPKVKVSIDPPIHIDGNVPAKRVASITPLPLISAIAK